MQGACAKKWIMMFVLGGFLIAPGIVRAQDPLEAGPDVYRLLFENERVRVLEFTFQPGGSIDMHEHPDHLAYILNGGTLILTKTDGTTAEFSGNAGDIIWIDAESHAAKNSGDTEVKGVVFELKEAQDQTK